MVEIIAEIGQNHNGDMLLAKELIHAAKENGADVAKFQLYDAVSLFPKENNPWYEYNCQTELSRDQVTDLNNECQKVGIEFMSSVFDVERIDWLESINVKSHKVASRSIKDASLTNAMNPPSVNTVTAGLSSATSSSGFISLKTSCHVSKIRHVLVFSSLL